MSSSSSFPASPLQPHHLQNLIYILRNANARYTHIATLARASLAPTRHAKRRATNLGLTVDIIKAINCPQKAVSVIPLPIVEVVTPLEYITKPVPSVRPVLKCTIPSVQTITPNGTISALTSGSVYSSITLTSAKPPNTVNAPAHSHWSCASDDSDRFPRDATDMGAGNVRAAEQGEPMAIWQPLNVEIDEDPIEWDLNLRGPQDASNMMMDVSPCATASSDESPCSPGSGSEAGSESSESSGSSEPVTPPSSLAPLFIRIKRKSMEIRDSDDDDDVTGCDKRLRVLQATAPQRMNIIRIPARK
ncbi:hypothetical protein H0H92_012170 [Tricholoma furcatifolium]|nr:hypothetical protein H0H92_012170 [Tricholoma furcatifolium]